MLDLDYSWLADPAYQSWLVVGVINTLKLAAISSIAATLIGMLGALALTLRIAWLDALIELFVEVFRNTPPLLQMLFAYFTLSTLGLQVTDPDTGLSMPLLSAFACAAISLSLFGGALAIEAFRSGIETMPRAIIEAGQALGYSRWARFWRIEAPIATRISLPALTNILSNLFKTTSQASVITVPELMYYAGQIYNDNFRTMEVMILVLVIYVTLVSILTYLMARLERWMAFPGYGKAAS
ncbi:amino acid ABC transporter permease [Alloyangia pacifica]|uniref:Polar amino acid transport system permease protein n=1 Tax=Alloyangia pacifica TaxID=311180 RepID=A0A1I6RN60_9RHOB|nr:amino acid ABC transporter permease [Alloyangia pacifica]SDG53600.1 polar amino acid transport system permease protein [Alloyangia pacifica]SFS66050.1 polar amino acid transport system permease protein [Alloyangia pacifica]